MTQLVAGQKIDAAKAAQVAYPTTNNAKEMGYKAIHAPAVTNEITEMLDKAGMTKPALLWKLKTFIFDSEDEAIQAKMWPEAAKLHSLYPESVNKNLHVHTEGKTFLEKLSEKAQADSSEPGESDTEPTKGPAEGT